MADEAKRARLRAYSRVGWGLTALLVAVNLVQLLLLMSVRRLAPQWIQSEVFFWGVMLLSQYCIAMPLFWLITRSLPEAGPEPQHHASLPQMTCLILMMIGFSGLGGIVANLVNLGLGALKGSPMPNPSASITDHNVLAVFLFVCIIGPVMEEWVFRGILVRKLRPYGDGACLLLSAILFALLHCNSYQTPGVLFGALVMAYARIRTGSLMHAIALHVTWNLCAVMMQHLVENLYLAALAGLGLLCAVVLSIVLAVLTVLHECRRPAAERLRFGGTLRALATPGMLVYCLICMAIIVLVAVQ